MAREETGELSTLELDDEPVGENGHPSPPNGGGMPNGMGDPSGMAMGPFAAQISAMMTGEIKPEDLLRMLPKDVIASVLEGAGYDSSVLDSNVIDADDDDDGDDEYDEPYDGSDEQHAGSRRRPRAQQAQMVRKGAPRGSQDDPAEAVTNLELLNEMGPAIIEWLQHLGPGTCLGITFEADTGRVRVGTFLSGAADKPISAKRGNPRRFGDVIEVVMDETAALLEDDIEDDEEYEDDYPEGAQT